MRRQFFFFAIDSARSCYECRIHTAHTSLAALKADCYNICAPEFHMPYEAPLCQRRASTSGTLAVEKRTSDVPACQHVCQRKCWPQPVLSRDSRNEATQSIRTGTACRLTMSRTLACMLTTADDSSAHWNTRLFQWNTRANPSVPDQIVTQRPETHNAHLFSVI